MCESIQKNPSVIKMKSSVLGSTLSKPVWFGLFFLAGVTKYYSSQSLVEAIMAILQEVKINQFYKLQEISSSLLFI